MKTRIILAVLLCAALLTGCAAPEFRGSCVKSASEYHLEVRAMNGSDSHTLSLRQGEQLRFHTELSRGTLRLEVRDPAGEALYTGNAGVCEDFSLNIASSGSYTIHVTGRRAAGRIDVFAEKEGASAAAADPAYEIDGAVQTGKAGR